MGDLDSVLAGAREIPVTGNNLGAGNFLGQAKFNVENALAAAAIAYSMGVTLEHIRQGLRTFTTSFFQAPGRCNVFDEHPFRVIVDYGHNQAAMAKMADFILGLRRERTIGVLMAAGDRRDDDIRAVGREAGRAFDIVVPKEDSSRRGRKSGEIAALLAEGAREAGRSPESIFPRTDEKEAIELAMSMAKPGDLVVIFADDVTAVWKQVIYWGKERTSQIPPLPHEA